MSLAALSAIAALATLATPPAAEVAVPAPVQAAATAALALRGARAEVEELSGGLPAGCALARAELPQPLAASARLPVHLRGTSAAGQDCDAWAWVRVRVKAPSLVTVRAVLEGAPLASAVTLTEREVSPGRPPVPELPEGATAARSLPAGVALDETHFRVGPRPGEPVAVTLRAGDLVVEQQGQAFACRRGRACALLPSGRRVEGTWHDGRIELESP
jgi:hypothetical protein